VESSSYRFVAIPDAGFHYSTAWWSRWFVVLVVPRYARRPGGNGPAADGAGSIVEPRSARSSTFGQGVIMKSVAILGLALFGSALVSGVSQARPAYVEESAVLLPPNNGITYAANFGFQAATNGQYALVAAERAGGTYEHRDYDALLYRRTSGGWQYVRILASGNFDFDYDDRFFPVQIGMKGNLASIELSHTGTKIFRYNGTDWVPAGTGASPSEDVSIDGDRIL
jgi:hypothetical protein